MIKTYRWIGHMVSLGPTYTNYPSKI